MRRTRNWRLAAGSLWGAALLAAPPAGAQNADVQWPLYNNDYRSQRYSKLDQISKENVKNLKEVCRLKVQEGGSFQTGPIVVDGTMYITTARDTIAVEPATCKEVWRYTYKSSDRDVFANNRGAAYVNGKVVRGTADGRLFALDAKDGTLVWKNDVGDPLQGEFLAGAPIAWNGIVYAAVAGSDWGARGRVLAFDAATGRELWRFNLIPMGDEAGADTWQNKISALTGGGGSWSTFTLDMSSGELFVPVGNPAPDYDPKYRPGRNLYTDSVVVLDARTGALKWYYQLIEGDEVDLDLGAAPLLLRTPDVQDIMVIGGKDGYVRGVDRMTKKEIYKTAVTTVDKVHATPTKEGVKVCPGSLGGVEWNGPAYDPKRQALFVGAVDWCSTVTLKPQKFIGGETFFGGAFKQPPIEEARGWITSLDSITGKIRWQYGAIRPVVSGVTPTAGGLVFAGDTAGNFLALDSDFGTELLKIPTGGMIAGGVITYTVAGKQYVAATSGNVSRFTFGELGDPTLIVFSLP